MISNLIMRVRENKIAWCTRKQGTRNAQSKKPHCNTKRNDTAGHRSNGAFIHSDIVRGTRAHERPHAHGVKQKTKVDEAYCERLLAPVVVLPNPALASRKKRHSDKRQHDADAQHFKQCGITASVSTKTKAIKGARSTVVSILTKLAGCRRRARATIFANSVSIGRAAKAREHCKVTWTFIDSITEFSAFGISACKQATAQRRL